ncbi:MAG TPA: DUF4062 domain-containing protein, partial [Thermoanaerobaculia bacterium]|nr:DUF4062 domain-containing protein [Thermoanaerobaculia bacterium]
VLDAILKDGHLPAGMELFPALDATAWDVIKRVVDDSDYYVVVVGGMYGSTDRDGVSYTEREYEYARSRGIPVLAFLHRDPAAIPAEKLEPRKGARKKLASFRRELEKRHTCSYWREAHDLRVDVPRSLTQQINLHPGVGWMRASDVPDVRDTAKALKDLQNALDEIAAQRGFREAAERRAQMLEAEFAALRKHEADARTESEGAARELKTEVQPEVRPRRAGPPGGFDVTAAKDVLAGQAERVASFAIWSDTPQGHVFWSEQKKRMESGRRLSPDAQEAIVKWVEEAQAA